MSSTVPAGWYPDPDSASQLRYWDGAAWTEHRSPAAPNAAQAAPAPSPADQVVAGGAPSRSLKSRRGLKIGGGILAALFVIGLMGDGGEEDPAPASSSAPAVEDADTDVADQPAGDVQPAVDESEEPKPEKVEPAKAEPPANPYGPQSKQQEKFLQFVTTAQGEAEDADNDLQRGAALSTRNESICQLIGSGKVQNWTGEIVDLDANGEGKGILGIELADNVVVTTWNNAFSDIGDETLIEADTKLFSDAVSMEEGQIAKFSGEFVESMGGPCINDSRMTLGGSLEDPSFIFRFSDIAPVR